MLIYLLIAPYVFITVWRPKFNCLLTLMLLTEWIFEYVIIPYCKICRYFIITIGVKRVRAY